MGLARLTRVEFYWVPHWQICVHGIDVAATGVRSVAWNDDLRDRDL